MSSEKNKRKEHLEDHATQKENAGKNNFNAGGNGSDYDGGQPEDTKIGSPGRIHSEEGASRNTGDSSKQEFNAGGADSDYDGGHPEDVKENSAGRIHSEEDE